MDNFQIDVTAQSRESLRQLIEVAMRHNCPGGKVTGWEERHVAFGEHGRLWPKTETDETVKALVYYWEEPPHGFTRLPWGHAVAETAEQAWGWLQNQHTSQPEAYRRGGIGFTVFTDPWGCVDGSSSAVVAVTLARAIYLEKEDAP